MDFEYYYLFLYQQLIRSNKIKKKIYYDYIIELI